MDTLMAETDRGAVLVGAAFIEHSLGEALRATIATETEFAATARNSLFSRRGPLSTAWARKQFAAATGLTDEPMSNALESIRLLRNHFAHTHSDVSFSDEPARMAVTDLECFSRNWLGAQERAQIRRALPARSKAGRSLRARAKFAAVVGYIVGYLDGWTDYSRQANGRLQPTAASAIVSRRG